MKTTGKYLTRGMFLALVIVFFSFAASAVVSHHVFERLPHLEDEFAYLYQAKVFAGGHAWVVRNEPVKYFWQPFIIQPETSADGVLKRFGKYTPGWPLLLAIGVLLGQTWIVNAFLGMLTAAIVYRLAREIFDEAVGVVAALLLAISPMVLLLNATLMSHTSAMFMAVVFVYCYWRTTRNGRRRYVWGIVAGLALGWIIATRPLTAVAIAAPIALHALARLIGDSSDPTATALMAVGPIGIKLVTIRARAKDTFNLKESIKTFKVLLVLAVGMVITGSLWGIYNQVWTGNWRTNVYQMLWPYDVVGFGPNIGLNGGGHSLAYGWRNARSDLTVYNRDLFGFELDPALEVYANRNFEYGAGAGLSIFVLILALIAGRKHEWVWVFFEFVVAIVLAQLLYWIGSTVDGSAAYSLRYYYEATFGACIVTAYGVVAWARSMKGGVRATPGPLDMPAIGRPASVALLAPVAPIDFLNGPADRATSHEVKQPNFGARVGMAWNHLWPGYFILLVACGLSLLGYTPARFREPLPPDWNDGLWHYNAVGQYQLDTIKAMREKSGDPTKPVLIVVLSHVDGTEDNWRDYGAAMAMTSPYLDGDIVVCRVFAKEDAPDLVKRFPGRVVLYQIGQNLYPSADEAIATETAKNKLDTITSQ